MKTYVILFRAINVGGKNIIIMKELTSLLESLGFHNVKSYIQSGNVVLKSETNPKDKIQSAVEKQFGFFPDVFCIEKNAFEVAIKNNPFSAPEGKAIHFYFCSEKPKLNQQKIDQYIAETEQYKVVGNVFYLFAPDGVGRSKLVANIDSCLGLIGTGRNLNTVGKLQAMIENLV